MHGDDFSGRDYLERKPAMPVPRQFGLYRRLNADEKDARPILACREYGAFHFSTRRMIASHCVQGYGGHQGTSRQPPAVVSGGKLGRLGGGVNHFASLVVATARAGPVGQLLFMAMGTFGEGQRRQMIVRPPVRGAALRVTSFWIGHCSMLLLTGLPVQEGPNGIQ